MVAVAPRTAGVYHRGRDCGNGAEFSGTIELSGPDGHGVRD
jgi:hypothetical protein